MNREEFEKLSDDAKYDIVVTLILAVETVTQKVTELTKKVCELETRLNQNSSNSSKPPSSDVWKLPTSQRKSSGAKPGGQPGHSGKFLKIEREPDETIELKPRQCGGCGRDISREVSSVMETRHKIDVEIRTTLTKYEQYEVLCPCCGIETRGEFPESVKSHVSYGEGVQSIGVLLTNYANVSYDKTAKIMNDVFEVPVSTGTLVNHANEFALKSEPIVTEIKEKVQQGEVGHFDETGVRAKGEKQWLHVSSNSEATHNTVHKSRGLEGTNDNGVLLNFKGTAVHDCLVQYFGYANCKHAVCNAHLLRDLQGIIDNTGQVWAGEMQQLLRETKKTVDEYKAFHRTALPQELLYQFADNYKRIVGVGEVESPRIEGEKKQTKSRNILDRFIKYPEEIRRFAGDFSVPFDNNQAERDIRNAKVKMKVSGGFRSDDGAKNFGKISSVIGTAVKQGRSVFKTVSDIFSGSLKSIFAKPVTAE